MSLDEFLKVVDLEKQTVEVLDLYTSQIFLPKYQKMHLEWFQYKVENVYSSYDIFKFKSIIVVEVKPWIKLD